MAQSTRSKYLEYLPAMYQEHPFLGEYLAPFEEVLTGVEDLLSEMDRFWAPDQSESPHTDPDFLPWLATWVALVLDEEWDKVKQGRLIREAVELYRERGTIKGLKRYLEIYTGLKPEIRECCWPSGFQVGVSSQVGSFAPEISYPLTITRVTRREPVYYDYYVVDMLAPDDSRPGVKKGESVRLYYRADRVERVVVAGTSVAISYFPPDGGAAIQDHHEPADITRRDHLIDDVHQLQIGDGTEVEYHGDTFLVEEEQQPYRFIVDVRVPAAERDKVKLDKVRAIVDLEKPAHTQYYLKLTLVTSEYQLHPMQVGIYSSVGVDTYIG